MCMQSGLRGKWINFIGVALVLTAGVLAAILPTGYMTSQEAFLAYFIVVTPFILFGLLFLGIGRVVCLLEGQARCNCGCSSACGCSGKKSACAPKQDPIEIPFVTATAAAAAAMEEPAEVVEDKLAQSLQAELMAQNEAAIEPAAPAIGTVTTPSTEIAVKEGEIAGRKYRLFADGSLEIDTNQSTIRFDSMDEFRQFIQNPTA